MSRKMKRSTLRDVVANRLGLDPSDDVLERKVNEFCLFYMEDGAWEDKFVPVEYLEFHPIPDSFTDNITPTDRFDVDLETIRKQERLQPLPGFSTNEKQDENAEGDEGEGSTSKYMKKYSRQNEDNLGMESLRRLAIAGNKRWDFACVLRNRALLRGLSSIESTKQRKSLLARRLRHAGFRWKGKYPSEEDIREVLNDAMGSNDEEEEQEKE